MSGIDSYYTPPSLAKELIRHIDGQRVKSAIDFCVGDGDLLKAVSERYPDTKLFGTDISEESIKKLKHEQNQWKLDVCDFVNPEQTKQISFLKKRKFDLIVLNPPFTCKGSTIHQIEFDGIKFKVSTSMLFVLNALNFIAKGGGMYAILPISVVYSVKDRKAWTYLRENYNACVLSEAENACFSKCSPNIVMVFIGNYVKPSQCSQEITCFKNLPITSVARGRIRMQNLEFDLSKKSRMLIHTTNIINGTLSGMPFVKCHTDYIIDGYGVVVPRVCNPSKSKVALLDGKKKYLISDCIIVFKTNSMADSVKVKEAILNNWTSFAALYKGTGARYTTISRLEEAFGLVH